eukprot:TRINITY_DN76481_c0_g1_i1.p1 TRINITY_DN76481_c0_g1~~TRINITY_DN76481_c0_g1_i1.p1  ORF type:complete len:537 (-),score=54.04 TRINITY_DN76481_c0_g1_i1:163-1617(-)
MADDKTSQITETCMTRATTEVEGDRSNTCRPGEVPSLDPSQRCTSPLASTVRTQRSESPAVDRHPEYSMLQDFACSRFQVRPLVPQLNLAGLDNTRGNQFKGSSRQGACSSRSKDWPTSSARAHSSARGFGLDTWTASRSVNASWGCSSARTSRSARGCGVAVRVGSLPRQDTIPCRNSGRRTISAADRQIRIFVRLPGKGRLAVWVPPSLLVGPSPAPTVATNCFSDFWGADAEIRGPLAGRSTVMPGSSATQVERGRLSPFRRLLAEQTVEQEGLTETDLCKSLGTSGTSGVSKALSARSMSPRSARAMGSLKGLLETATGVPAERQKLVFGTGGTLEDDYRALCDYDVGHGALLYLSVRPAEGTRKNVNFLASHVLALSQHHDSEAIFSELRKFLKSKVGGVLGKDIIEPLRDWETHGKKAMQVNVEWPREQPYHDYTDLPDNSIFDLVGRVRKRFGALPKLAVARPMATNDAQWAPHTVR